MDGRRPEERQPASSESPGEPRSAQVLARRIGRGELDPARRKAVLAEAARLPEGPIRDLFAGYLPESEPGRRKLGPSPRPRAILALEGDPVRGEPVFWSRARCGDCHQVKDRGKAVGPDLSAIGRERSREELLESLLEPSRKVDPKFAAFTVATADGRTLAGLIVARDEAGVVLRDSRGDEIRVPAREIEDLRPSRASLMPDGQLADLTPQEAADLLAYLGSLRQVSPR
jgi:putative heme-binding domain-containing protein